MDLEKLKKIDYRQEKYWFPLIIFAGYVIAAYFICRTLDFEVDHTDKSLEQKSEINTNMPKANIKGDGIGNRYDNLVGTYGKIKDATAIDSIKGDNKEQKETYESKYSDAEIASLERHSAEQEETMRNMRELQRQLQEAQSRNNASASNFGNTESEEDQLAGLRDALFQGQQEVEGKSSTGRNDNMSSQSQMASSFPDRYESSRGVSRKESSKAVKEISEDAKVEEVVKVTKEPSEYFNTICENEPQQKLIKAIVDEETKAVDGSRLRLRLLDDIEIQNKLIPKGTYLYATMSGFSTQRAKGKIESILFQDQLLKINLSLYDTDGLEGIYVPESIVGKTAQDMASGALSSQMNMSMSTGDSFTQWANQGARNVYQRVSQAISKAIKKNKVRIKYGTVVYLVNSKEKKQKTESQNTQSQNRYYPGSISNLK